MKKIHLFAVLLLFQINYALNIHQIRLSEISPSTINVSLDTEARELYYFHSWRLQVSGNKITIEAFYVEGFGSTIAYLNNNFEIPIIPRKSMIYDLNVKIYYKNGHVIQTLPILQDQWSGLISTPLSTPIFIINPTVENPFNIYYQNPNPGFMNIGPQQRTLYIFDESGIMIENKQVRESINFSHLPDGKYYFRLEHQNTAKTIPIILKK